MDSKILLIVALATALTAVQFNSNSTSHVEAFESFKSTFNKAYESDAVEAYRFAIYVNNKQMIEEHNADATQTYKMGINQFTDVTAEEFASIYLGFKPEMSVEADATHTDETFVGDVNWVTKGMVQKVKDQGQCGSCWAFSAAATTESLAGLVTGTVGDFSEQELVSCCAISHLSCTCMGCNGGNMGQGLGYYKKKGICTESSYPYTAESDFSSCAEKTCTKSSFTISGHTTVKSSDAALKSACDKQPVSIGVDASNWSPYSSGIFSNCGTSLDHGVLLAGYTSSYWLVKNSWGASWGEDGYIRLASGNTCGIENQANYPNA